MGGVEVELNHTASAFSRTAVSKRNHVGCDNPIKYAQQPYSLVGLDAPLPHFSSHPASLALVVLEAQRLEHLGDGCHQSKQRPSEEYSHHKIQTRMNLMKTSANPLTTEDVNGAIACLSLLFLFRFVCDGSRGGLRVVLYSLVYFQAHF